MILVVVSLSLYLQFTFLVVEITPISIKSIGYRTYIYFAVFNACFIPLIYFFYPESAGLTLENIDYLFTGEKVLLHYPEVSTGQIETEAVLTISFYRVCKVIVTVWKALSLLGSTTSTKRTRRRASSMSKINGHRAPLQPSFQVSFF